MNQIVNILPLIFAAGLGAQETGPVYPDTVQVELNIAYDKHKETVLDVVRPKSGGVKRPGVLFIHGGGWVGGSKESVVKHFVMPYVEKGYVVANVEYRLAKVATAPAAVQDVLKAAEWFRRNAEKYGVDPKKIIASGGSAGGHLSLMVGVTPKSAGLGPQSGVAAVVNFYGITDVLDQLEGPNTRKYAVEWVPESTPAAERREMARRVSPQSYVRKGLPPILTIHGDTDPTVPYEHGVSITKMLRDEGNDAEMINVPGGLHGDFMRDGRVGKIWEQIFAFLAKRKLQ
jgi:acetyl esterase/lipase